MPLLDSSCFLGLPPNERLEQIYLALGGADTGCFIGQTLMEQLQEMLVLIGSDACIFTPEDFWREWLLFLDPDACTGIPIEGLQQAVYALLYAAEPPDPPVGSLVYSRSFTEEKAPGNPLIILGSEGSIDAFAAREGEIWFARGAYWCLYDAWPDNTTCSIAVASALNFYGPWTKYGEVIPRTVTPGTWGFGATAACGTFYDEEADELHIWVTAAVEAGDLYTGPLAITYYVAGSGLDWTDPSSYVIQNGGLPVLQGGSQGWEGAQGVYAPQVLLLEGVYTMFYSSSPGDGSTHSEYRIGVATAQSLEGPWVKLVTNPVMSYIEEPCVIKLDGGSLINYSDTAAKQVPGYGGQCYTTDDPTGQSGWELRPSIFSQIPSGAWDDVTMGPFTAIKLPDNVLLLSYSGNGGGPDNRQLGMATVTVAEADQSPWSYDLGEGVFSEAGGVLTASTPGGVVNTAWSVPRYTSNDHSVEAVVSLSAGGGACEAIIMARGTAILPFGNATAYLAVFGVGIADSGIRLYTQLDGVSSPLSDRIDPGDIQTDTPYRVILTVDGTGVSGRVQRESDSFWLNPSGDWQVDETEAVVETNSDISDGLFGGLAVFTSNATEIEVSTFTVGESQGTGGGGPTPTYLLNDAFSAPNGTNLNGRAAAPVAGPSVYSIQSGTWTIQNSQARQSVQDENQKMIFNNVGSANVSVSSKLVVPLDGLFSAGVMARYADSTHFWLGLVDLTGFIGIFLANGAGPTEMISTTGPAYTGSVTLNLVCDGNDITLFVNGDQKLTFNSAVGNSNTSVGLYVYAASGFTNQFFDNFRVIDLNP